MAPCGYHSPTIDSNNPGNHYPLGIKHSYGKSQVLIDTSSRNRPSSIINYQRGNAGKPKDNPSALHRCHQAAIGEGFSQGRTRRSSCECSAASLPVRIYGIRRLFTIFIEGHNGEYTMNR